MQYKVLIIEDDPMVAMINGQYVSKNPLFTVSASFRNGQEALDFLETNSVDLIVLDVFMPYMDGIETLKKIRERKISSEVIMVTAANDSATIEQTMHLGVIDYLIKPFAYERFQVALEKFVSQQKILKSGDVLDQSLIDNMISSGAGGSVGGSSGASGENRMPASEKALPQASSFASVSTSSKDSFVPVSAQLPKGIQRKTLLMICDYISKNPSWQTVGMISDKLGISIVTARHYLSFLEEQGFIVSEINYDTGGRPSILYEKKQ